MDRLTREEERLVDALIKQLEAKTPRNLLRDNYMDGKNRLKSKPLTMPPQLSKLDTVLGWPEKAVNQLANRISLQGFTIPGHDLDDFGLTQVIDDNDYLTRRSLSDKSALVHSVSFQIVTAGGPGEPEVLIHHKTALDATGFFDERTNRLTAFLSVNKRYEAAAGAISDFSLYTHNKIVIVENGKVVDRIHHKYGMPVEMTPYNAELGRPFGRSRITRPMMYLTDMAARTLIRSELTADIYGVPSLFFFGIDADDIDSSWKILVDRVTAIPDDNDPDVRNPRAAIEQLTQGSQTPHMEQLKGIAGLFAGESDIPVSSLGVGFQQANPTSEGSYVASREDLIQNAENITKQWSAAHKRTMITAYKMLHKTDKVPPELLKINPEWRDPRFLSLSQSIDSASKLIGSAPELRNSPAIIKMLSLPKHIEEELIQEQRKGQGSILATLIGKQKEAADGKQGRPDLVD